MNKDVERQTIELRVAGPDRLGALAGVLGRAFVSEPGFAWALDGPNLEARLIRAFELYLERLLPLGVVWEAGDALGAMVLIPADRYAEWEAAVVDESLVREIALDGGVRHVEFWNWLTAQLPDERTWQLDSIGVEAFARGRGVASALIRHALAGASAAGYATTLETGTPGNVPMYQHFGFQVVGEADPPSGGPHIWFLRKDP